MSNNGFQGPSNCFVFENKGIKLKCGSDKRRVIGIFPPFYIRHHQYVKILHVTHLVKLLSCWDKYGNYDYYTLILMRGQYYLIGTGTIFSSSFFAPLCSKYVAVPMEENNYHPCILVGDTNCTTYYLVGISLPQFVNGTAHFSPCILCMNITRQSVMNA